MKRLLILALLLLGACSHSDFESNFLDNTLRLNLVFEGGQGEKHVHLDSLFITEGWMGRKVNLRAMSAHNSMEYALVDTERGDTLFLDSKLLSLSGPDTPDRGKTFIYLPEPKKDVRLHLITRGMYGDVYSSADIDLPRSLVEGAQRFDDIPLHTLLQDSECESPINITILADGYAEEEMPIFLDDARSFTDSLFAQSAFAPYRDRFRVTAVQFASYLGAMSDSYGMQRLITLPNSMRIPRALKGLSPGHVMILVNHTMYGGSGAYNEYALCSAHNPYSSQVLIHEFGHSFVNLGDEYEEGFDGTYVPEVEPDEPNITTMKDFGGKWQNLIDSGQATLIEGAGYQPQGVWRGCEHCIMRTLADHDFCPVCSQAISRLIALYTEK